MAAVKVKKVKPYPIPVQIAAAGATPFQGQIVRLVLKGFMVDMQGKVLKVGSLLQVNFELPVLKVAIAQNVKIMKTYDQTNPQTRGIDRIAECHFTALSDEQQNNIYTFLQTIRQNDIA